MQLVDKIEKRRFVGREFLLWLWFESELFDATLSTAAHGSFGLWLEKRLTLSAGKQSTRIVGPTPGLGREAKEALLAGQLPESAGVRIAWRDDEKGFVLKAEQLAIAGLRLNTVLDQAKEEAPTALLKEMKGGVAKSKRGKGKKPPADDEAHEKFYERMQLTSEFEELLEALYSDFRALRLSERWASDVVPALRAWVRGQPVDAEAYAALKQAPPERKAAGA
ncbi:MAG TPA: hypothetical protein VJV78_00375 [Polyangiales bacterium]|nr:hypothetical protein [Polyangiales bacterium]